MKVKVQQLRYIKHLVDIIWDSLCRSLLFHTTHTKRV